MRLTKRDEAAATRELLDRLRAEPAGLRTRQLIGSARFNGVRTLKPVQIIRLLRTSGAAVGTWDGCGNRWALRWRIKQ